MSDRSISLSVLLPVHRGIDPSHLRRALESLETQTFQAKEVVLVEDGPLEAGHHEVIEGFESARLPIRRVKLSVNGGAGVANQAGLKASRYEWIAKMDADDISVPDRFERQAELLAGGSYDLVGSALAEFGADEAVLTGLRIPPLDSESISRRMRINNPINHPTSVYRRDVALKVGGYTNLRYMQDYDLFARMLMGGARMINISEPLVLFRAGDDMLRRRKAWKMFRCELTLQRNLVGYGVISTPRGICNLILRSSFRLLPHRILRFAYRRIFITQEATLR